MKKILSILFILLMHTSVFSQGGINTISTLPQFPSAGDTVRIVVSSYFTSGDCPLDSSSVTLIGTEIGIDLFHCQGPLTYICNSKDTLIIGVIGNSAYNVTVRIYSGGFDVAGCAPYHLVDSGYHFFDVGPTGIETPGEPDVLKYHSSTSMLYYTGKENAEVVIYDLMGKVCSRELLLPGERIQCNNLVPGTYFYTVRLKSGSTLSGRFSR